jgi:hypothetical protein
VPTPAQEKRARRKAFYEARQVELDQLARKSIRHMNGNELMEFRPRPVDDCELSSRLGGPAMKTWQWTRE